MFLFSLSASGLSLWERLAVWYENSFFNELFVYLRERYFSIDFGAYDHIPLPAGAARMTQTVIFALAAAIILVAFMNYYHRVYLGRVVRALIREEAHSPEKAKTLMELGFFRSALVRRQLSSGTLRKLIRCTEEEEYVKAKAEIAADEPSDDPSDVEKTHHIAARALTASPYRMNFITARFYIPEELRHRASVRYERKGSGLIALCLVVIGAILFAALACFILPDLLQLIDNIINMTSPA